MATLSDVARLAGISLSTASRALNGTRGRVVHPELVARAMAAARELNYVPNAAAQTMARGRSQVIALVVNDIRDPYFSSIAAGVMGRAAEAGQIVTMSTTLYNREALVPLLGALRQQRPGALLIAGGVWNEPRYLARVGEALAGFQSSTEAIICLIGQARLGYHAVTVRNRAGAYALGTALAGAGFTTAAILTGPALHPTAARRTKGFEEGFGQSGRVVARVPGDFTRDGGYDAMLTVLDHSPLPGLVFAVNDVMAVGAMAAARDRGVRIPEDIGLAGYDDIPTLQDVTPALTTVRVPMQSLGSAAVDLVLAPPATTPTVVTLSATPVLRHSTAVPR